MLHYRHAHPDLGPCEDCGGPLAVVRSFYGVQRVLCLLCHEKSLQASLRNIFNQVRLMTPEKELYFILKMLIGTDEDLLLKAEQLLAEMRESNDTK